MQLSVMPKIIVGNWKMIGVPEDGHPLLVAVAQAASRVDAQVVVCPSAVWIERCVGQFVGSPVLVGGQDCHAELEGAHTGDIGAPQLKAAGCTHVIIGHSERRAAYGETDATVKAKALRALEAGLTPIICIGETLAQREAGKAAEIVSQQLRGSLPGGLKAGKFLLAYEPVWAIGSGKTPSNEDISQMHGVILKVASELTGIPQQQLSVLYGGSVKPENAQDILATAGVAGVLVGGASVKASDFCRIIDAA